MRYYVVLLLAILMACGTSRKALEAAELRTQTLAINKEIEPYLEQLIQFKNSINLQGRALTSIEMDFVKQVEFIESSYTSWKKKYVEILKVSQQRKSRHDLVEIKQKMESILQMAKTIKDK